MNMVEMRYEILKMDCTSKYYIAKGGNSYFHQKN